MLLYIQMYPHIRAKISQTYICILKKQLIYSVKKLSFTFLQSLHEDWDIYLSVTVVWTSLSCSIFCQIDWSTSTVSCNSCWFASIFSPKISSGILRNINRRGQNRNYMVDIGGPATSPVSTIPWFSRAKV